MDSDPRTVDVLRYETDEGAVYRAAPAGEGEEIVAAHERELRKRGQIRLALGAIIAIACVGYGVLTESLSLGLLGAGLVAVAFYLGDRGTSDDDEMVPELVERNQFREDAAAEYDLEDG